MAVTLTAFMHAYPDHVDVLLVAPTGQPTLLMADSGGRVMFQPASLTFDDSASGSLLDGGMNTTGTYRPTIGTIYPGGCIVPSSFPAPAPAGPYGPSLSAFDGASPNGTWSLYVIDDNHLYAGSISAAGASTSPSRRRPARRRSPRCSSSWPTSSFRRRWPPT